MLESSFIHCPGVGPKSERKLWSSGIADWSDFLGAENIPMGKGSIAMIKPIVEESCARYESRDANWFAKHLPPREHWRAWPTFRDNIAYLDIETTGGMYPEDLTLIGMYEGAEFRQFIKGQNLSEFPAIIANKSMIVTFFGTGFDLPFLRRAFGIEFPQLHVDLCFTLKRLGLKGGLKSIERQLGLDRSDSTSGLDGMDAVRLWFEYQRGRESSLQTLLDYNREDVVNLENIMEWAWPRLVSCVKNED